MCAIGIGGVRGKIRMGINDTLSCALPECWQYQSDFSNGQGVRECHVSIWSGIITAVFQGI